MSVTALDDELVLMIREAKENARAESDPTYARVSSTKLYVDLLEEKLARRQLERAAARGDEAAQAQIAHDRDGLARAIAQAQLDNDRTAAAIQAGMEDEPE